jgi:Protein of unknown function (DUF541)
MSAQLQIVASGRRRLAGLLFVPLLVVLAGCSTAAAPAAPGTGSIDTPSRPASGALGAPSQGPGTVTVGSAPSGATGLAPDGATEVGPTGVATSGGGVVSSGAGVGGSGVGVARSGAIVAPSVPAIAYPYPIYPGSPGVAPDHTIVVAGVGRADVKADLSDQAGAQRDAIQAALADARAQADVVARAAGVTITGVLSVSVSSGGAYAVPMAGAAGSTPGAVPGGAPNIAPAPLPVEPTVQQLVVSVTVAYRIS